ncbi:MAG: 1-aminocyclopropane-1-carboxylate deaminase/D-cysteine desulfhydrase [Flavobacteriaceae bacterium]|nr:pyridoxal-phosphate dependent enzyme [Eudoraea sp.]NNJ37945.1 1-aminocyclopropane-1-carboxylate deaminase/D-cysteine desulfhydrase [Flavobacteriaceae bacterium]
MNIPNEKIKLPVLQENGLSLVIKREDLTHPIVSGNKYRKLKYNLQEAREQGYKALLTFGGAYSNHIAATAHAGFEKGFKTIGIIRGEELEFKWHENPTLYSAHRAGMQFHFVSRKAYRQKATHAFLSELKEKWGAFYLLPEGGTNTLAVKGCEELLQPKDRDFDVIAACVGTGGTLAGLINSAETHQEVLGFPVVRDAGLHADICNFARKRNWRLVWDYHFGGYAKVTPALITFINQFKHDTGISLDPIYTGKLLFGLLDMMKKGEFQPNTRILAIHSGGLQGIAGMNQVLKDKNLPLIEI